MPNTELADPRGEMGRGQARGQPSTQAGTAAGGLLREQAGVTGLRGDGRSEAHLPPALVLLRWFLRPFCPGAPASLHNAEINPGRYYFSYLPGMMLCLFRVLMMGSGEFFRGQEQRSHIKQPCECGRRRQSSRWQRKAACTPEHPWPAEGKCGVCGISAFQSHSGGRSLRPEVHPGQKYVSQRVQRQRAAMTAAWSSSSPGGGAGTGSHWSHISVVSGLEGQFGGQPPCDRGQLSCQRMSNGPVC